MKERNAFEFDEEYDENDKKRLAQRFIAKRWTRI
jgi:hypothetical protein